MILERVFDIYRRYFWSKKRYAEYRGVSMGTDCWIATHHFGSEPYLISIGNHVQITDGVRFFTHGGGWVLRLEQPDFDCFGKIKVGNNVYIGNSSMIMPGVTIGSNVIIGAASVVTKSVPDGVAVAGNPAKIIGTFDAYKHKMQKYNLGTKNMDYQSKKNHLMAMSDEYYIQKSFLS